MDSCELACMQTARILWPAAQMCLADTPHRHGCSQLPPGGVHSPPGFSSWGERIPHLGFRAGDFPTSSAEAGIAGDIPTAMQVG